VDVARWRKFEGVDEKKRKDYRQISVFFGRCIGESDLYWR
jgi:hypothetical protein